MRDTLVRMLLKHCVTLVNFPVVFDNMSSGLRENLFPGIPFVLGDILEPEQLKSAIVGVDSIIHLAALKAAGESMGSNHSVLTISLFNFCASSVNTSPARPAKRSSSSSSRFSALLLAYQLIPGNSIKNKV